VYFGLKCGDEASIFGDEMEGILEDACFLVYLSSA
jgi:hypothetical protein